MKRLTEAQIRQIIKEELKNVLNENLSDQQIEEELKNDLGFRHFPDMDNVAKGKRGWVYDNQSYGVAINNKFYSITQKDLGLMTSHDYHGSVVKKIDSTLKGFFGNNQLQNLPSRPYKA